MVYLLTSPTSSSGLQPFHYYALLRAVEVTIIEKKKEITLVVQIEEFFSFAGKTRTLRGGVFALFAFFCHVTLSGCSNLLHVSLIVQESSTLRHSFFGVIVT